MLSQDYFELRINLHTLLSIYWLLVRKARCPDWVNWVSNVGLVNLSDYTRARILHVRSCSFIKLFFELPGCWIRRSEYFRLVYKIRIWQVMTTAPAPRVLVLALLLHFNFVLEIVQLRNSLKTKWKLETKYLLQLLHSRSRGLRMGLWPDQGKKWMNGWLAWQRNGKIKKFTCTSQSKSRRGCHFASWQSGTSGEPTCLILSFPKESILAFFEAPCLIQPPSPEKVTTDWSLWTSHSCTLAFSSSCSISTADRLPSFT